MRQGKGWARAGRPQRRASCCAVRKKNHSPPMRVAEGHARMRPVSTGLPCPPSSKFQRQASRHAEGGALACGRRPLCHVGCGAVGRIPRSSVSQMAFYSHMFSVMPICSKFSPSPHADSTTAHLAPIDPHILMMVLFYYLVFLIFNGVLTFFASPACKGCRRRASYDAPPHK